MRYFKVMGLCLVVVFAVSAMTVASASATVPTLLFFIKKGEKVAEGTEEAFTSKTGAGELKAPKAKVECKTAENSGTAIAGTDRAVKITITFHECEAEILKTKVACKTAGQTGNTIVTKTLDGELGYIHEGEPLTVGFVLKPEEAGGLFAEFKCLTETIKVRGHEGGGVISEFLPESVGRLIDPGEDAYLTFYATGTVQEPTSLKVLGTLVDNLYLESKTGSGEYEQSSIKEAENVELLSNVSFEVSD